MSKRRREESPPSMANGDDPPPTFDLSLLEAVEKSQSQSTSVETLDLRAVKKLILSFERRLSSNLESRMKHPDHPEKFVDSEVDLHDEIDRLRVLASAPDLYPDLVSLNAVPSLAGLLGHDNTDIGVDAVSLLLDLTDEDVLEDNHDPARILVDALVYNNALELLVQNISRLSEADPDEAAAIHDTLSVVENMIEVKPAVADLVCERTKLLRWLLNRIKIREFDANKQYASEILAILFPSKQLPNPSSHPPPHHAPSTSPTAPRSSPRSPTAVRKGEGRAEPVKRGADVEARIGKRKTSMQM